LVCQMEKENRPALEYKQGFPLFVKVTVEAAAREVQAEITRAIASKPNNFTLFIGTSTPYRLFSYGIQAVILGSGDLRVFKFQRKLKLRVYLMYLLLVLAFLRVEVSFC